MRKHVQFLELQQASALSAGATYVTQDLGQMQNPSVPTEFSSDNGFLSSGYEQNSTCRHTILFCCLAAKLDLFLCFTIVNKNSFYV